MIVDRVTHSRTPDPEPLEHLRRVPFVKKLRFRRADAKADPGGDGEIEVQTPDGPFHLIAEGKRSYLTRSAVDQLLAWLHHLRTDQAQGAILLARHIPRPVAERLIEAKVNFADDAGNIHLQLGDTYNWTVIGLPAPGPQSERRPTSPAQLQLLFQFVTHPDSVEWPVRRLAAPAGISKSKGAQARHQMIAEGLLVPAGKRYHVGPTSLLADRLVLGYAQLLRPKLMLGRFRSAEATPEAFLARLHADVPPGVRYSLTGGPAADLLQHFYRGPEVPLFLEPATRALAQQLRLLPDREGPVTVFRAFGELVFWEEREHHMLAPPWLIYAELLSSNDPRAHEAAREFRREFLT